MTTADFTVQDHGTVWSFRPETPEAQAFTNELGIESWQFLGAGFAVDHRPAQALLEHIETTTDLTVIYA